jgi:Domain of unknown function DUF29
MGVATKQSKPSLRAEDKPVPYETDFYTWTQQQGALLRAGRLDALDRENLAEEIESLGRNEFDKLVSFYRLILLHMLKWEHQPNLRSRSWTISIDLHRTHAEDVVRDNPGLKSRLDEAFERAYRSARLEAVGETGLPKSVFPETCPFTRDEMLTRPYVFD